MTTAELQIAMKKELESLKESTGCCVEFSPSGPVSFGLIQSIVATIETLEHRIAALEKSTH